MGELGRWQSLVIAGSGSQENKASEQGVVPKRRFGIKGRHSEYAVQEAWHLSPMPILPIRCPLILAPLGHPWMSDTVRTCRSPKNKTSRARELEHDYSSALSPCASNIAAQRRPQPPRKGPRNWSVLWKYFPLFKIEAWAFI